MPDPVNDLDRFAIQFGTDKATWTAGGLAPKSYTIPYHQHLVALRDRPLRFLEIGVARGASLRMWEAYFPHAEIWGIDIDPRCKEHEAGRVRVRIGSQTDPAFLRSVVEEMGGTVDVVIDDGGHRMNHHRASLEVLFPRLTPGGLYAIEDLHTAYSAEYGGGYQASRSTIELLKQLVDEINGGARLAAQNRTWWQRWTSRSSAAAATPVLAGLERLASVHFYRSLAILAASSR